MSPDRGEFEKEEHAGMFGLVCRTSTHDEEDQRKIPELQEGFMGEADGYGYRITSSLSFGCSNISNFVEMGSFLRLGSMLRSI